MRKNLYKVNGKVFDNYRQASNYRKLIRHGLPDSVRSTIVIYKAETGYDPDPKVTTWIPMNR